MDENGSERNPGYILFVWSPAGWTMEQREGDAPSVGETLEAGETTLRVSKLGASPLPGDRRRCAYTQLA